MCCIDRLKPHAQGQCALDNRLVVFIAGEDTTEFAGRRTDERQVSLDGHARWAGAGVEVAEHGKGTGTENVGDAGEVTPQVDGADDG